MADSARGRPGQGRLLKRSAMQADTREMRRGWHLKSREERSWQRTQGGHRPGVRVRTERLRVPGCQMALHSGLYPFRPRRALSKTNLAKRSLPQLAGRLRSKSEPSAECHVAPQSLRPQSLATPSPTSAQAPCIPPRLKLLGSICLTPGKGV